MTSLLAQVCGGQGCTVGDGIFMLGVAGVVGAIAWPIAAFVSRFFGR